jgi:hypothetical protein
MAGVDAVALGGSNKELDGMCMEYAKEGKKQGYTLH